MTRLLTTGFVAFLLSGCVGPAPRGAYVLANTAILAAKSAEAAQYAPTLYIKAQQYYVKGQRNFSDREYSDARKDFTLARQYAEKAEDYTMLKKSDDGDAN